MDQKIRRVHAPAFKAKVALEALKEQKTIAELSGIYSIHTTQITKWKKQALDVLVLQTQTCGRSETEPVDVVYPLSCVVG